MPRFKSGQSGNPKGRPKGSKDKRTALRELLKPHAPDLISKAVELALDGDTTALKLCLDRLMPPFRTVDEPVLLAGLGETLTDHGRVILEAVVMGHITPSEAVTMLQAISLQARITEIDELERRVSQLEQAHGAS